MLPFLPIGRAKMQEMMTGGKAVFVGPLDGQVSLVALSTRRLYSTYTGNCVKVRRGSDNVEQDFGFTTAAGWLDIAAISVWLNGATGYVTTWYDQSGNGKNAVETNTAKQPSINYTLTAFGNKAALVFAGGQALATAALDLTATKAVTLFARATSTHSDHSNKVLAETSINFNDNTGSWAIFSMNSSPYHRMSGSLKGNVGVAAYVTGSEFIYMPIVLSSVMDMSLAAAEPIIYFNGTADGAITSEKNNTGNFGNFALYIGARAEGSLYWKGNLSEMVLFASALAPATRQSLETQIAAAYPDNTLVLSDDMFLRTVERTPYVYRRQSSPYARGVWNTNATSVDVEVYIGGEGSPYDRLGVIVNGTAKSNPTIPAGTGIKTVTVDLGVGVTSVELINNASGGTGGPNVQILGVTFNAPATRVDVSSPRICIYGDSITSGIGTTNPVFDSWPVLVKPHYNGSIAVEAYPGRRLWDDGASEAARIAFAARFAAVTPAIIYINIGTNDYGSGDKWSAADFGTAYADFLDKLHAVLPGATIYCQTPIVRVTETANTFGNTLNDYRDQVTAAAAARPAFCVAVNGTGAAFPQLGDLAGDGLHVTTAGNVKYAAAVEGVLGL